MQKQSNAKNQSGSSPDLGLSSTLGISLEVHSKDMEVLKKAEELRKKKRKKELRR